MKPRFYLGLLIIAVSELLLFAGIKWVGILFTPIVWTGYILFVDGLVFRIKQDSWLAGRPKHILLIAALSSGFWWMFEFCNLFIRNWRYEGLPTVWISVIAMTWAFATVGPGMLETRDLLEAIGAFDFRTRTHNIRKIILKALIVVGATCIVSIFVFPVGIAKYLGIPLWVGFILLLDPINCLRGRKSIFGEWQEGRLQNFLCLFVGGLICGFLWEFWNYWAHARWVYQVPYASNPKIFEMPLLGYLGFPALALEYYAFYNITVNWKAREK
jgi:hypothetical protein